MTSSQKQIAVGVVVTIAVTVGVYAWFFGPANNDNFPDGTWWVCEEADCKHEFGLTTSQLSDHYEKNYGKRPTCPKCKKDHTNPAVKCEHCGKVYKAERDQLLCPFCKKERTR
jgi:hypothetical protein